MDTTFLLALLRSDAAANDTARSALPRAPVRDDTARLARARRRLAILLPRRVAGATRPSHTTRSRPRAVTVR